MKNIQISKELFCNIVAYHILGNETKDKEIEKGLEEKMDAIIMRELYTKSKIAPSEKEKESARQEYLDKKGITKDFRW